MNSRENYQAGKLADAIQAATDEVKREPTNTEGRGRLAELLCFAGEIERADKQIETIGMQDAKAQLWSSLFRQLLRGEVIRQQVFREGRAPELLHGSTPWIEKALAALLAERTGDLAGAAKIAAEAEEIRPRVGGTLDGQAFSDLRDLDDRTAGIWEVLTSTGKYFWVPTEQIQRVEFQKPGSLRDLIWRPAEMDVAGGPNGIVYVPILYPGSGAAATEALKLGRATDWQGADDGYARGVGQRMVFVDDDARPIMDLGTIEFSSAGATAPE